LSILSASSLTALSKSSPSDPQRLPAVADNGFTTTLFDVGVETMHIPGYLHKTRHGEGLEILHDGFEYCHETRLTLNLCKSSGQKSGKAEGNGETERLKT
jgi:hypothetical protein